MFETIEFYSGKEIDFDSLAKNLAHFGYQRQQKVAVEGDFAIRGSVIDIFPLHFSLPIRMELANNMVESIHAFDPSAGTRLEPHRMAIILPIKSGPSHRTRHWHRQLTEQITQEFETPIDPFVDIESGDLVVHILHGISRYRGIRSLKNKEGKPEDNLILEFADKNLLYVPMRDLHLIQRYVAFGKLRPQLSKLGSKSWERLKERTKRGVVSFASELLNMQAKRQALEGFRFNKDNEWQKKLEDEFPYEETPDQNKALKDVKADMESSIPMDRLLCGDVGYGKTEVALRAAFKAVMNGKQVAILVPTTVLAEQHYDTFRERMKTFPVSIGMLSRFQTKSEIDKVVKAIADGSCDLVIGTHRLLSSDVCFKDLGLVIIDEEQRFGVRHKEYLKKLRLLVDVLTLTATPIPRTLYMSIVGAKDMSTIITAELAELSASKAALD
jgi:transcription-repair coupling factor (superfamily II helicase)